MNGHFTVVTTRWSYYISGEQSHTCGSCFIFRMVVYRLNTPSIYPSFSMLHMVYRVHCCILFASHGRLSSLTQKQIQYSFQSCRIYSCVSGGCKLFNLAASLASLECLGVGLPGQCSSAISVFFVFFSPLQHPLRRRE